VLAHACCRANRSLAAAHGRDGLHRRGEDTGTWKSNTLLLPRRIQDRLAHEEVTLGELMKAPAYATFFAGKWHLGPEGFWPENQGYDINMGGVDRGGPYGPGKRYFTPYANPRLPDGPPGEHLPDRLATEACKFIETNKDESVFRLLLVLLGSHAAERPRRFAAKYEAKRQKLGLEPKFGREEPRDVRLVQEHAVYAAMVEAMDAAVGKVLAKLDELGLAKTR
jgi:arylsulfatase A-like enzyme